MIPSSLRPVALWSALFVLLLFASGSASAQADRFEKVVPFRIDESLRLDAQLGPAKVPTLKISNLGRGYGRGGRLARNQPSEGSTTLRFAFDVNNPGEDWELTFTIELRDKAGKVIDRVTKSENFEEEAKVYNVDHPILEYVVPMIAEVQVTIRGRLD